MGSLYGVGGQDGGELVLFLKEDDRLGNLSAGSAARQKELEQLKRAEAEATAAKRKEQAEIAAKQAELDKLDMQIAEMKGRLGSGAARSSDGLDALLAMAEQKAEQGKRLEELRQQRLIEEKKRQEEIENLKREALKKRTAQITADIDKYQKIATNQYAQDMKSAAWDALIDTYPEAKGAVRYDVNALSTALGISTLTFYDQSTGLMWAKNGNIAGEEMNWVDAMRWVKNLNYGGYSDWRLPTRKELGSFSKLGGDRPSQWFNANGFDAVQSAYYWSSSSSDANIRSDAWLVSMFSGYVLYDSKSSSYFVWPVRSGQF